MGLHEEQHPKLGNGSIAGCIGRSSKKNKPKKIPQRGLGVAQLEKLRLEEQQKNAGSSSSSSSPPSNPSQDHPNLFPLSADRSSAPLRHPISASSNSVDLFNTPYPLENSRIDLGGRNGHGFLPMLWNAAEPNTIEAETLMRRLGFHAILPNEYPNSGRQPSGVLQRRHPQPMPSTPLKNKSLSPTSGVSLQIEPPSNQNYSGNYKFPSCTEEERMVGMKRPWSFHLDSISNPFPCKVTPSSSSANTKDSLSFGSELIRCESKATPPRVGSSSASANYADWRTSDLHNCSTNKGSDGGFLTLGRPASSLSFNKQSQIIQPPLIQDHIGVNFPPSQGSIYGAGNSSQPFYSFLPGGPSSCGTTSNEQEGEISDGVDLSLKL
ncbi:uncharacterized protein [Typha latifolia]|uniref:uncharacterized protein n=1 Tax=Typha latifolia TaxID=4733 RepID=UPI003C2E4BA7